MVCNDFYSLIWWFDIITDIEKFEQLIYATDKKIYVSEDGETEIREGWVGGRQSTEWWIGGHKAAIKYTPVAHKERALTELNG
jgi:hypothetical protein